MIPNNFLSHSIDVFVNALFLFVYTRTRGPERPRSWLLYGALIGLAMMVRMPNVFLGLIPLAESVARVRNGERRLGPELARYAPLAAGLLLAMTPQMLVWKLTRGHWFLLNPYKGATHDTSDFLHPHLWEVLFSTNHGFLLWAPAFLIALLSLPLLARRDRRLTAGLALIVLLDYYLVSSWDYWNGDAAFGPRLFLNLLPIAVLGLSALLDRLSTRLPLGLLRAAAGSLVLWTLLLMGQYALKIHPFQYRRPRRRASAQPDHPAPRPLRPPPPRPLRPPSAAIKEIVSLGGVASHVPTVWASRRPLRLVKRRKAPRGRGMACHALPSPRALCYSRPPMPFLPSTPSPATVRSSQDWV